MKQEKSLSVAGQLNLGNNQMTDLSKLSDEQLERIIAGEGDESAYLLEMAKNIPSSAAKLAGDIVSPIAHPIETAKSIGQLGASLAAKAGIGNASPEMANAVGAYFADRYGGVDNVLNTLKEDPVGLIADVSTVLSGGGTLAGKLPSIAGKAGRAVSSAGAAIDPVMAAARGAKALAATQPGMKAVGAVKRAAKTGAALVPSAFTIRNPEVFKEAAQAGYDLDKAFLRHWSGKADMMEPVEAAKKAIKFLEEKRTKEYKSGMLPIEGDKTQLDFSKIENSILNSLPIFEHKGKVIDPEGLKAWEEIAGIVDEWGKSDPAQFHTPYDLDKLKQSLWNISKKYEPGTRGRAVANTAYNAVKSEIAAQAPGYSAVMSGFQEASEVIDELNDIFKLKDKKARRAAAEPALRRLQSVMRNNVATSYGGRAELIKNLTSVPGGEKIMPAIAGQELSGWLPRGLASMAVPSVGISAVSAFPAIQAGAASAMNPAALAYLSLMSPKVMGGLTYGTGAAGRGVAETGKALARKYAAAPAVPLAASAVERATRNPFTVKMQGSGIESLSDQELEELLSRYPENQ